MIDLMLEFHAWSTSRPIQESDRTADKLEKEIKNIQETELEQGRSSGLTSSLFSIGRPMFSWSSQGYLPGMFVLLADIVFQLQEKTRQRLADFINRIRVALAALTNI